MSEAVRHSETSWVRRLCNTALGNVLWCGGIFLSAFSPELRSIFRPSRISVVLSIFLMTGLLVGLGMIIGRMMP